MTHDKREAAKALYKQLRSQSWSDLAPQLPAYDAAPARERLDRVGLLRAVAVVVSESSTREGEAEARAWLIRQLEDPAEKIRRYAMAALAKLEGAPEAESALRARMGTAQSERESRQLREALTRVGSTATLESLAHTPAQDPEAEQRLQARLARSRSRSGIRMALAIQPAPGLRVQLRGRRGLEPWMRDEAETHPEIRRRFRVADTGPGRVTLEPTAAFTIADIHALRCFGTAALVLGQAPVAGAPDEAARIAGAIAAPASRRLLESLTNGPVRYRLDFIGRGARRAVLREVTTRVFEAAPTLLNDPVEAPWEIDVHPCDAGQSIELRPRLVPDPRFAFRMDDIAAASHPPLAACLARLAGRQEQEVVWDPFCGSGLELVERGLMGGVTRLCGTDLSAGAIAACRANLAAADLGAIRIDLRCTDFRQFILRGGLAPGSVSLVITNPPLGRRVRIPNLRQLIRDLLEMSARVLRPGGRLVCINPIELDQLPAGLERVHRSQVDLGGFDCWLERYDRR